MADVLGRERDGLTARPNFDATYRLLRDVSPVFVTTLNLLGLRAFTLDSGPETPGQADADPSELRDLVARATDAQG